MSLPPAPQDCVFPELRFKKYDLQIKSLEMLSPQRALVKKDGTVLSGVAVFTMDHSSVNSSSEQRDLAANETCYWMYKSNSSQFTETKQQLRREGGES